LKKDKQVVKLNERILKLDSKCLTLKQEFDQKNSVLDDKYSGLKEKYDQVSCRSKQLDSQNQQLRHCYLESEKVAKINTSVNSKLEAEKQHLEKEVNLVTNRLNEIQRSQKSQSNAKENQLSNSISELNVNFEKIIFKRKIY
jgi:DNA-binding ferritin-like protein